MKYSVFRRRVTADAVAAAFGGDGRPLLGIVLEKHEATSINQLRQEAEGLGQTYQVGLFTREDITRAEMRMRMADMTVSHTQHRS